MDLIKLFYKCLFYVIVGIILVFFVMVYSLYRDAKETVQRQVPEFIRLVAEDNCLDDTISYNGVTMKQAYINKLDSVSTNSEIVNFDTANDAIFVDNGTGDPYSRTAAPQRGAQITIRLRGYFTLNTGMQGINFNVPIEFKEVVIGTRYYRDR